jgi:hypothetical protein
VLGDNDYPFPVPAAEFDALFEPADEDPEDSTVRYGYHLHAYGTYDMQCKKCEIATCKWRCHKCGSLTFHKSLVRS